jgi:hypothetical protein
MSSKQAHGKLLFEVIGGAIPTFSGTWAFPDLFECIRRRDHSYPWQPQFQGISLAQATLSDSVAYVDRVDLTAPGISFFATRHVGPLDTIAQTTSQFLQSSGVQVAINANFFAPCCTAAPEPKTLIGLEVSNGTVVSQPAFASDDAAASLFISKENQATIHTPSAGGPLDLSNVYNAASGNMVVTAGADTSFQTPSGAPHDPFGLDPRTGVGLSQDGKYLYLIVIDGRQPAYSTGVTTADEAALMLSLGVYHGINLDGGGSTALVESDGAGAPKLIDRPSGGTERYDGNNFGVFADPLAVPEPTCMAQLGLGVILLGVLRRCLFPA